MRKQREYLARRVRLNSQGYDAQGSYWGHGAPLFFAERVSDGESDYVRAADAAHAREILAKRLGADLRAPRFGGTRTPRGETAALHRI